LVLTLARRQNELIDYASLHQ
jgi:hypothetical protein